MVKIRQPVLLVGESGTSKTATTHNFLKNLNEETNVSHYLYLWANNNLPQHKAVHTANTVSQFLQIWNLGVAQLVVLAQALSWDGKVDQGWGHLKAQVWLGESSFEMLRWFQFPTMWASPSTLVCSFTFSWRLFVHLSISRLHWFFVAVRELSLLWQQRLLSSSGTWTPSSQWLLLLWNTGFRMCRLGSCGAWA